MRYSILLGIFFFTSALSAQTPKSPAVIARECGPSVVTIVAYAANGQEIQFGSGFFLEDGRIATNTHVVEGASWLEISDSEGRLLGNAPYAEALSVSADIAILPRIGTVRPGLKLADQEPEIGAEVVVIGTPEGLGGTVSDGIVSSVRTVGGQQVIQISAPISHGSSGGPVLDRNGRVLGVSVGIYNEGQNLNFAVPAAAVTSLASSPSGQIPFPAPQESPGPAGQAPVQAQSPNPLVNFWALAEPIQPGSHGRSLDSSDLIEELGLPVDLYLLEGTPGRPLTVEVVRSDFDNQLLLFPPSFLETSDPESILNDDDGGEGQNAKISIPRQGSGDYLIVVRGYEGATGAYTLRITHEYSAPAQPAPGTAGSNNPFMENLLAQADPIAKGQAKSGSLAPGRELALYRFSGRAGEVVTVRSYGGTLRDTQLFLIAPSCESVECDSAYSDDDGGGGLDAQISVSLPESGDYVIGVNGYEGQVGTFSLHLSSGYAPAADSRPDSQWRAIGGTDDFSVSINSQNVRRSGSLVLAWFRWDYNELQRESWATFDLVEFLEEIRCEAGQYRRIQSAYFRGGQVEDTSNTNSEWTYARPGSVGEKMVREACRLVGGES